MTDKIAGGKTAGRRMTGGPRASRREFVALSLRGMAASGLALGLVPVTARAAITAPATLRQTFLAIDHEGIVTVFAKHLDMGQGIWSGLAQIVAEELDADWDKVRVEGAPALMPDYSHTFFSGQTTGGSTSIANSYDQLRRAGATARAMLVAAAARQWGVASSEIATRDGKLTHPSGKRAGYGEFAGLAAQEPVPDKVALKDPAAFRIIGKGAPRLDTTAKHRGQMQYGIDTRLAGMLHAVVARAPAFGAKILRHDASKALAIPGVRHVLPLPSGIAVVADNTWTAMRGREALVVEWNDDTGERRSSAALAAHLGDSLDKPQFTVLERGDATAALNDSTKVVDAEFAFPYLAHAPMEPLALAGRYDGNTAELWGGFQMVTANQAAVAEVLGLPAAQVAMTTLNAGGSFGRRASFDSDWVAEMAYLLKAIGPGAAVQITRTREDDMTGGYYRPMTRHRYRVGLDEAGRIAAVDMTIAGQSIFYGTPTGQGDIPQADLLAVMGHIAERYDIPAARVRWANPDIAVPVTTFRSIGNTHTTYAKEVLVDRLARMAGIDALDYRLAMLGNAPRQAAVLRKAAAMAGWGKALPKGQAIGLAVQESESSFCAQAALVEMRDGEIRVHKVDCAIDCGIALDPGNVRAQIEGGIGFGLNTALYSAITLTDGVVDQSNFADYPLLRIDAMPAIDVAIINGGDRPTGVGEPGSTPIGAAVAIAVERLTGNSVTAWPLAPAG